MLSGQTSESHGMDTKLKTGKDHVIQSRVAHVTDFLDFIPRATGGRRWVLSKGVTGPDPHVCKDRYETEKRLEGESEGGQATQQSSSRL